MTATTEGESLLSLNLESFKPREHLPFSRDHIFHSILRFSQHGASDSHRLDMLSQFNMYEKCLIYSRSNNPKMAGYWMEQIHKNVSDLPTLPQTGMNALYFPMLSYFQFKAGRHEEAMQSMNIALENIATLRSGGLTEAILAEKEQQLNKLKILISWSKTYDASTHVSEVFKDLFADLSLAAKNEADWIDLCEYYVDSIIYFLCRAKGLKEQFLDDTLTFILNSLTTSYSDQSNIRETIELVKLISQPALDIRNLEIKPVNFSNNTPSSLNYLLCLKIGKVLFRSGTEEQEINQLKIFMKDKLQVPAYLLTENMFSK